MIKIRKIDAVHKQDIRIPNQPFPLFGRLLPAYQDGRWSWQAERFAPGEVTEMCFPDENYDYDAMQAEGTVFLGAYDGERCIGLAVLQPGFFRYLYLYDLKVSAEYRAQHVGAQLIEAAKRLAAEQGCDGLYTQGQDNNLGACLFYLHTGFYIGGLDTNVYKGTAQEGKADVIFYIDI